MNWDAGWNCGEAVCGWMHARKGDKKLVYELGKYSVFQRTNEKMLKVNFYSITTHSLDFIL